MGAQEEDLSCDYQFYSSWSQHCRESKAHYYIIIFEPEEIEPNQVERIYYLVLTVQSIGKSYPEQPRSSQPRWAPCYGLGIWAIMRGFLPYPPKGKLAQSSDFQPFPPHGTHTLIIKILSHKKKKYFFYFVNMTKKK